MNAKTPSQSSDSILPAAVDAAAVSALTGIATKIGQQTLATLPFTFA
jgi:hypothetical protein